MLYIGKRTVPVRNTSNQRPPELDTERRAMQIAQRILRHAEEHSRSDCTYRTPAMLTRFDYLPTTAPCVQTTDLGRVARHGGKQHLKAIDEWPVPVVNSYD